MSKRWVCRRNEVLKNDAEKVETRPDWRILVWAIGEMVSGKWWHICIWICILHLYLYLYLYLNLNFVFDQTRLDWGGGGRLGDGVESGDIILLLSWASAIHKGTHHQSGHCIIYTSCIFTHFSSKIKGERRYYELCLWQDGAGKSKVWIGEKKFFFYIFEMECKTSREYWMCVQILLFVVYLLRVCSAACAIIIISRRIRDG